MLTFGLFSQVAPVSKSQLELAFRAVLDNDCTVMLLQLISGLDSNARNERGFSLLHRAVLTTNQHNESEKLKMIALLLRYGAKADDVVALGTPFSVLLTAVRRVLPEVVTMLLQEGAINVLHFQDGVNHKTALEYAREYYQKHPDDVRAERIVEALNEAEHRYRRRSSCCESLMPRPRMS